MPRAGRSAAEPLVNSKSARYQDISFAFAFRLSDSPSGEATVTEESVTAPPPSRWSLEIESLDVSEARVSREGHELATNSGDTEDG